MAEYDSESQHEIIQALTKYLADTAIVYFKTHGYHWNVEGETFYSLHLMFEKFYISLWESMDEVAERIRALGAKTPGTYMELLKHSTIQETEAIPAPHIMVKNLHDDYLILAKKAQEVASLADVHGDLVTTDLLTQKAAFLEKAAWMLQSSSRG